MSEAAWEAVAGDNNPPELKPMRDMVVTDGQALTLGDVTITFYVTPGQTPGTLSMIIEPLWNNRSVTSDEDRHVAAFWGGADIAIGRQGVRYFPDGRDDDEHLGGFHTAVQGYCHRGRSRYDPHDDLQPREHSGEGARVENHESDCNARCRRQIWRLVL